MTTAHYPTRTEAAPELAAVIDAYNALAEAMGWQSRAEKWIRTGHRHLIGEAIDYAVERGAGSRCPEELRRLQQAWDAVQGTGAVS